VASPREPKHAGTRRSVADELDEAASLRDQYGYQRDEHGEQRDHAAEEVDQAAEMRDRAAEQRDQAAKRSERLLGAAMPAAARRRSARARGEASADRKRASQDRKSGARQRAQAGRDRSTALADRGASAKEREFAALDALTGAYLRNPGFMELEREMARATRTEQPLVLAFVDVDHLKIINDSRGHAAGDRMLIAAVNALRANLRTYDLITRYGGDEFLCTISGLNVAAATKRFALVNPTLSHEPEHGSVTIGLAALRPGDSPEDLIARADAALYRKRRRQRTTALARTSSSSGSAARSSRAPRRRAAQRASRA
jgi:diguanylate cyclase (GGDEF)-like protein